MSRPRLRDWLSPAPEPAARTKALTPLRNWLDDDSDREKEPAGTRQRPNARLTNTLFGTSAGVKSLLEAFRSNAPGAWSDNRYAEALAFIGVTYLAVKTKCEQAAASTIKVYKRDRSTPDGKIQVTHEDPLFRLLDDPNENDTAGELLYQLTLQEELTGSALLWAVPNSWELGHALRRPARLFCLHTATATPLPPVTPTYPHGAYRVMPLYPYGPFSSTPLPLSAAGAVIPAEQVVRIMNPHPLLRYDGYSPLTATRTHRDSIEAIDRSRLNAMLRGVDPSAVMTLPEESDNPDQADIDRIRAEFEALFSGPDNVGRLFVATNGASVAPFSHVPNEMGWENGWSQLTSFMLACYGVTKPVAGMVEESSYATLYAALKQFHLLSLCPLLRRLSGKLTKHLGPMFGPDYLIEIEAPRIDDEAVTESKNANDLRSFAFTKNEWRVRRGEEPTDEPWGKEIVGVAPQPAPAPGSTGPAGKPVAPESPGGKKKDEGPQAPEGPEAKERGEPLEPPAVEIPGQTGKDGQGSLGPRKALADALEAANGHGNGHGNGHPAGFGLAGLYDRLVKDYDEAKHPRGGDPVNRGRYSKAPGGAATKQKPPRPRTPTLTRPAESLPVEVLEEVSRAWSRKDAETLAFVASVLRSRPATSGAGLRALAGAVGLAVPDAMTAPEVAAAVAAHLEAAPEKELIPDDLKLADAPAPDPAAVKKAREADDYVGRLQRPFKERLDDVVRREKATGITFVARVINGLVQTSPQEVGRGRERYQRLVELVAHGEHVSADDRRFMTDFRAGVLQRVKFEDIDAADVVPVLEFLDEHGLGTLAYSELRAVLEKINVWQDRAAFS